VSLFPYLSLCVIFSAIVASMASGGGKLDKVLPASLIVIEVLLLLVAKGFLDIPSFSDTEARQGGCAIVAILAFSEFMRRQDKAFPLLAFFAGLTQLLVVLDIVSA